MKTREPRRLVCAIGKALRKLPPYDRLLLSWLSLRSSLRPSEVVGSIAGYHVANAKEVVDGAVQFIVALGTRLHIDDERLEATRQRLVGTRRQGTTVVCPRTRKKEG